MVTQDTSDQQADPPDISNFNPRRFESFYYTAVKGDFPEVDDLKWRVWECGFNPIVFKKHKEKSKGVDITLAKDLGVRAVLRLSERSPWRATTAKKAKEAKEAKEAAWDRWSCVLSLHQSGRFRFPDRMELIQTVLQIE